MNSIVQVCLLFTREEENWHVSKIICKFHLLYLTFSQWNCKSHSPTGRNTPNPVGSYCSALPVVDELGVLWPVCAMWMPLPSIGVQWKVTVPGQSWKENSWFSGTGGKCVTDQLENKSLIHIVIYIGLFVCIDIFAFIVFIYISWMFEHDCLDTCCIGVPYMQVICIFCICTCSAQLSMFHMERHSRNMLIIIIIIIIIVIIIEGMGWDG